MQFIYSTDLFLISGCFPLLEDLDLSDPIQCVRYDEAEPLSLALFKLRKVNLSSHHYINDRLLFDLFKKREFLEEVILRDCYRITEVGIVSALRERPTLKSLSISNPYTRNLTHITSHFIDSLVSLKGLDLSWFVVFEYLGWVAFIFCNGRSSWRGLPSEIAEAIVTSEYFVGPSSKCWVVELSVSWWFGIY